VTTAPWRAAGADISDFFNYGLTERSWRAYTGRVARFRAAYDVRNAIRVLGAAEGPDEALLGVPAEVVAAVRQYRSMVSVCFSNRSRWQDVG
jgi:pre-mRNA 3'-end-processing factor FIP1